MFFSIGILALIFCSTLCAQNPIAHWSFDEFGGKGKLVDSITKRGDDLMGFYTLDKNGVKGQCLNLDGYTSGVQFYPPIMLIPTKAFSIEAWVAPQVYPWNWTAIVDATQNKNAGFRFAINQEGQLGFKVSIDEVWHQVVSQQRLPLLEWSHVAVTFDSNTGSAIYINGKKVGQLHTKGSFYPPVNTPLYLGRSKEKQSPAYSERQPSRDVLSTMVLDGLLDEVAIYDSALSESQIMAAYNKNKPNSKKPLTWRKIPIGPKNMPKRFAATYCRLDYDDEWERLQQVADHPDILVTFDNSPVRVIFWRGANYGAVWASENGILMADQSMETNGDLGCYEHMSDKQCRYSHVRIIESNDARAVIHWRYALNDIKYGMTWIDDIGRGEWTDEYYYFYPDGTSTRHWIYWSNSWDRGDDIYHQFQETIFFNQPGTKPEDNIDINALTLANMKGETHTYSWENGIPPEYTYPKGANIQIANFKSNYKPYIIFEEGSVIGKFIWSLRSEWSKFPWWNHWPVGQLANDGRCVSGVDRPSHSSITSGEPIAVKGKKNDVHAVCYYGMTDQSIDALVPLAKAWDNAPELAVITKNVEAEGFNKYQKAYLLNCKNASGNKLEMKLKGSKESPVINPAFVIKNWGTDHAKIEVNGKEIKRGKDFRYGHEHTLMGTDLIVWVSTQSNKFVNITLSR